MGRSDRRQGFWLAVLVILGAAGMATIAALGPDSLQRTAEVVGFR
jgi:hypothetical protein